MVGRECSEMVGRLTKREDEAWCDGFMEAHNAQACAADGLRIVIEELEEEIDELTEAFNALADMMRRER